MNYKPSEQNVRSWEKVLEHLFSTIQRKLTDSRGAVHYMETRHVTCERRLAHSHNLIVLRGQCKKGQPDTGLCFCFIPCLTAGDLSLWFVVMSVSSSWAASLFVPHDQLTSSSREWSYFHSVPDAESNNLTSSIFSLCSRVLIFQRPTYCHV
jgi:hypothetical protein